MTSSRYNYDGNCTGLLCDNVRLIAQITGIIHRQYDEKYAEEIYEKEGLLKPASVDECYIDGIWNKESEEEWLTEIQLPIEYSG